MNEHINDILNREIVRETLLVVDSKTDDALVERIWELSAPDSTGDAVPLYQILKIAGKL